MKTKTRSLYVLTAALLASLNSVNASLIAYEGFDYSQKTALSDPSISGGGTGWTDDWDSGSWRTNFSGYPSAQPGGFENDSGLTYTG